MSGLLCSGDLLIALYNSDGTIGGYLPAVNATEMSISVPSPDVKQRQSKMRDSYGQIKDSVSIPKAHQATITLDELAGEVLAMAFSGSLTQMAVVQSTITDKVLAFDGNNWVDLGTMNLSAVIVQDTGATITRVEGVDYEINTRLGLIRALPGGACVNGDKLSAVGGAVTGDRVAGATKSQITAKLKLDGLILGKKKPVIVTVDKVCLYTSGKIDFLASDFGGATLQGDCITLPGNDEPYTVITPIFG